MQSPRRVLDRSSRGARTTQGSIECAIHPSGGKQHRSRTWSEGVATARRPPEKGAFRPNGHTSEGLGERHAKAPPSRSESKGGSTHSLPHSSSPRVDPHTLEGPSLRTRIEERGRRTERSHDGGQREGAPAGGHNGAAGGPSEERPDGGLSERGSEGGRPRPAGPRVDDDPVQQAAGQVHRRPNLRKTEGPSEHGSKGEPPELASTEAQLPTRTLKGTHAPRDEDLEGQGPPPGRSSTTPASVRARANALLLNSPDAPSIPDGIAFIRSARDAASSAHPNAIGREGRSETHRMNSESYLGLGSAPVLPHRRG